MKNEFLLDSLQAVDLSMVQEAGESPKKRSYWFIPAAAALVLVVCAAAVLAHLGLFSGARPQTAPSHTAHVPASVNLMNFGLGFDKNIVLSYKNDLAEKEGSGVDLVYDYTPDDSIKCIEWVPFFRCDGRLYWYAFSGLSKDKYLGGFVLKVKDDPSRSPIDCIEGRGYASGDFYEVRGYDPAFMLCTVNRQYPDELDVYVCDNGYSVTYGRDVLEERFLVSAQLRSVVYEDADSIFHAYGKRFSLQPEEPAVKSFIEALDSGVWCVPYETEEELSALCDSDPRTFWLDLGDFTLCVQICSSKYARIASMFGAYFIEVDEQKLAPIISLMDASCGSPVENTAAYRGMTLEDAMAEPSFGRFVPRYAVPGQTLDYCMGKYDVEHGTGKTLGIERLHIDFGSDSGKNEYVWFDIEGESALVPKEEEPRTWIEIGDLTPEVFTPVDVGSDDDYLITCVHGKGVCITVTSMNIPRDELIKAIRSCFENQP